MDIEYQSDLSGISPAQLPLGFFEGWLSAPTPDDHFRILKGSSHVVLAFDRGMGRVVGFITAVSDGVSCAYIPFLEVLPSHRRQGIGRELVMRMLAELSSLYMVDLSCDED